MKVLSINQNHTVGLCDAPNSKSDFVGYFNPVLLKEWITEIINQFGTEPVYLYSHKSSDVNITARNLAAADEPVGELQVCVTGIDYNNEEMKGC